jgi:hypothetical protein
VENLSGDSSDGESYHGYWAQNIHKVNSNFGTSADLVALSAALHDRGMYLMVDVVTNHMGYLGCGTCVDYSVFTPFNSVCPTPTRAVLFSLIPFRNHITIRTVSSITTMLLASRSVGKETTLFHFLI